ncbi:hypothetical protein niasHT_021372 [Heterodera trifolii]|uniref:Uncharacterized protein n=1 Tax=Heterodera trifolii TaxID=157864 RepID=A0ABD2K725_9BILA
MSAFALRFASFLSLMALLVVRCSADESSSSEEEQKRPISDAAAPCHRLFHRNNETSAEGRRPSNGTESAEEAEKVKEKEEKKEENEEEKEKDNAIDQSAIGREKRNPFGIFMKYKKNGKQLSRSLVNT